MFSSTSPRSGCTDVLLHITAIEGASPEELKAGQRVQFETVTKMETLETGKLRRGTFPR
jgi:cold shock CspA family protein